MFLSWKSLNCRKSIVFGKWNKSFGRNTKNRSFGKKARLRPNFEFTYYEPRNAITTIQFTFSCHFRKLMCITAYERNAVNHFTTEENNMYYTMKQKNYGRLKNERYAVQLSEPGINVLYLVIRNLIDE